MSWKLGPIIRRMVTPTKKAEKGEKGGSQFFEAILLLPVLVPCEVVFVLYPRI
jgi:hypothetical protein